jgi:enoyl-CoA hydratase/carnithine racemase
MPERIEIDSGTGDLLAEIRERVAVITLNRPQALNALTAPMRAALSKLIESFGEDPRVGSILITAEGRAFCAGADVKRMAEGSAEPPPDFDRQVADLRKEQRRCTGALIALRKPTVAAIGGAAAGMGLSLALACDIRIAGQSGMLTTAFARIGIPGDFGIAWLLTRLVGFSRARELMFLSERIGSDRAEKLGLVNRVVPDADLNDAAFAIAKSLGEGPPIAYALIKDNLDHALHSSFDQSLDREAEAAIRSLYTEDRAEGVRAFVEKRKPVFQGR